MKKEYKLLITIASLLLSITFSKFVDDKNTIERFIIIVLVSFSIVFLIEFVVWIIMVKYLHQKKNTLNDVIVKCKYDDRFCCSQKTFNNIENKYDLYPNTEFLNDIKKNYSLHLQKEMIEKEERDFKNKNGKEIWVVSSNLDSEIVNGNVPDYITDNITNGIKYVYFYSKNQYSENPVHIENNKSKIKGNTQDNLPKFLPYGKKQDTLPTYLFYLFNIVFYIKTDNTFKAYFSIRKKYGEEPIYYKMPICMAEKYYNSLKLIQTSKK